MRRPYADIVPYYGSGGSLSRRDARSASQAISRLSAGTQVELVRIDQQAELQIGRLEAIHHVGEQTAPRVASLTAFEQQLAELVPAATDRLRAVGDLTTLAMIEVVRETGKRVR